uniref:Uncharacterized protein n=1 Tax=Callithrix jacchus TaxID=9483 RepID=A0A8I3WGP1_CALJA
SWGAASLLPSLLAALPTARSAGHMGAKKKSRAWVFSSAVYILGPHIGGRHVSFSSPYGLMSGRELEP